MKTRISFVLIAVGMACFLGGCGTRLEDKLVDASAAGDVQKIQSLLSRGINVNCASRGLDKSTPLILAVMQRRTEAVDVLLAAGADPNLRDAHSNAALFYAFTNQQDLGEIIKLLIAAGADADDYRSLFSSLPGENPNRIAFEEASKQKLAPKHDDRPSH